MIEKFIDNLSNEVKALVEKQKTLNNFTNFIYIMDRLTSYQK